MNKNIRNLSLFAITWPILIEVFLHMALKFSDTFMLSFVSDEAVAAIGVVNQLMMFMFILFNFTAMGCGVVVSQFFGADKPRDVSRTIANATTINLIFGIIVSAIVVIFRAPLLAIFNLEPALMEYADIYMIIVGSTLFTQAMILTTFSALQAQGFTKDVMYISLGMNVLNIFGNYVFIFGALGFPELGVTGVAIATAASRALAMIAGFVLIYRRTEVRIKIKHYIELKADYVKKMLNIGIPGAGENLSYNASQIVITALVTLLGTTALATRIYTNNYMMVMTVFSVAMAKGIQIYIGQLVGAGMLEHAYKRMYRGLKVAMAVSVAAGAVLAIFPEFFLGIFTDDAEIIAIGGTLLLIGVLLEPGRTTNLVVISSLRAAGDARFPVIVGIFSMWGIGVLLSYVLGIHLGYGLIGVWIARLADEWFRAIFMILRWRSRKWQRML
ncbi:MATE family efflux transporter [Bacillus alkalicola]|uniref:MATE family efflux transporter n=2 Tax=Bacillales TaxID=1385 RepID=A0ABS6K0I7_9BACI|nr:MATE family efflux transporter [Bacillus alkalicola]